MENPIIPKPVTIVSFASPYVGNKEYRRAFQLAEQKGLVRHLRVTNRRDAVPLAPMMAIPQFRLYKHVGLALKLYELHDESCDCEFQYPRPGLLSKVQRMWVNSFFLNLVGKPKTYLKYHGCAEHSSRLDRYKIQLSNRTLEDVYQEFLNNNNHN